MKRWAHKHPNLMTLICFISVGWHVSQLFEQETLTLYSLWLVVAGLTWSVWTAYWWDRNGDVDA